MTPVLRAAIFWSVAIGTDALMVTITDESSKWVSLGVAGGSGLLAVRIVLLMQNRFVERANTALKNAQESNEELEREIDMLRKKLRECHDNHYAKDMELYQLRRATGLS